MQIVWSQDSRKFALVRRDQRKVEDLWVINALAHPRPTLETYRYAMPGEVNITQYEIDVFDVASHAMRACESRSLQGSDAPDRDGARVAALRRGRTRRRTGRAQPGCAAGTMAQRHLRQAVLHALSRDLHKVDAAVASPDTGEVKVVVEERLNTYIETKPLRLANNGQDLLFWSERNGWGHYYLYDANTGALKNR